MNYTITVHIENSGSIGQAGTQCTWFAVNALYQAGVFGWAWKAFTQPIRPHELPNWLPASSASPWSKIWDDVSDWSCNALTPPRRDPLAIDLDGDGIETVGVGNPPILFEHNNGGIKTGTGWLKGDDAWLVMDRKGNGQIDSDAGLFGVDTQITVHGVIRPGHDGFEALKALDGNNDGLFNVKTNSVRLWQGINQDGISELISLRTKLRPSIYSVNY